MILQVTIKSKRFVPPPLSWIGRWKRKAGFLQGTQKPQPKANKQFTAVFIVYEVLTNNIFAPLLRVIASWRSNPRSPHDCRNCDVALFCIPHLEEGGAAAMALAKGCNGDGGLVHGRG